MTILSFPPEPISGDELIGYLDAGGELEMVFTNDAGTVQAVPTVAVTLADFQLHGGQDPRLIYEPVVTFAADVPEGQVQRAWLLLDGDVAAMYRMPAYVHVGAHGEKQIASGSLLFGLADG